MPDFSEPVIWNSIKIEYVGPLSLDYVLDGKNRNAIVKLTALISNIYYQVAIEGIITRQRRVMAGLPYFQMVATSILRPVNLILRRTGCRVFTSHAMATHHPPPRHTTSIF